MEDEATLEMEVTVVLLEKVVVVGTGATEVALMLVELTTGATEVEDLTLVELTTGATEVEDLTLVELAATVEVALVEVEVALVEVAATVETEALGLTSLVDLAPEQRRTTMSEEE